MFSKKLSIKDVAKEAKVSISTVSYVVNNKRFVGEERKKRVLEAVEKLNYRPNIIAKGLRTKKIRAIGVLASDLNPYYSQVIKGMEEVARKRNYILILGCTFYDPTEEKRQMDLLLNNFIEGIIFLCGYDSFEHLKIVYDNKIPIVVVDREICNSPIPSVLIDNFLAMKKATNYLISLGHKEIGYITFCFDNQTTVRKRYEGYLAALKENNINYDQRLTVINNSIRLNEEKGTYKILKELLKKNPKPSAFLTLADNIAIGLIKALKELGLKIPDDVSVMGFGDEENISEFCDPSLSTIRQPNKLMGQTSMNLLIDIIEKKKIQNKNIILPTELIIRESAKKMNK